VERCAIFSCMGLGDGLLTLILSHNLRQQGCLPTTFHPHLSSLQSWFPELPIQPFPSKEQIPELIDQFDRFFIFYERKEWMLALIEECEKRAPEKLTVLNPIATRHHDYPYWEHARFEGDRCMVDNLFFFCQNVLHLKEPTRKNGLILPQGITPRRFPKRVVLHPMSSRPGKNWPKEKFLILASQLEAKGYTPAFILSPQEQAEWKGSEFPRFASLAEMAAYICESGYMIGNDSGIGHLASCFGLPTVTICRSGAAGLFWRPGWAPGKLVTPYSFIPNIKGLRLRDQHWKKWISVKRVLSNFLELAF
jgi:heptosyltransferase-3